MRPSFDAHLYSREYNISTLNTLFPHFLSSAYPHISQTLNKSIHTSLLHTSSLLGSSVVCHFILALHG